MKLYYNKKKQEVSGRVFRITLDGESFIERAIDGTEQVLKLAPVVELFKLTEEATKEFNASNTPLLDLGTGTLVLKSAHFNNNKVASLAMETITEQIEFETNNAKSTLHFVSKQLTIHSRGTSAVFYTRGSLVEETNYVQKTKHSVKEKAHA